MDSGVGGHIENSSPGGVGAARDAAAKVQILDPGLHGLGAAHAGTHVRRLVHRDQPMARFQERMGEPPDARAELENARLLR